MAEDAVQCGFCTPGQVVSATALLERVPHPTREQIHEAMAGNICRCGTYPKIERAILRVAGGRMTARFVRTRKEMEGRYEDVWALVDESDDVQTWAPDAELSLVGQPAPRFDGMVRATGRARYTVDVRLAGMLHAAVLRSPVAHGRVRALDLERGARRSRCPGRDRARERALADTLGTASHVRARAMRASRSPSSPPTRSEAALEGRTRARARHRGARARRRRAGGRQRAAVHRRAGGRLSRRRRGGARGLRGDRRGLDLDAGAAADPARAPRSGRLVGRRRADGLGVDAGDVLRARRARGGVRAAQGRSPGTDGVRRRRVRRRSRVQASRRSPRRSCSRITGRPVRLVNDRHAEMLDGGRRFSTQQTYRLGATHDGTLTAIEAEAVLAMGQGGWAMPTLVPARTLYRCADVGALSFPARTNLRPRERVQGAGRDGGDDGVRAGDRRARDRAGDGPARAATTQSRRRRPGERPALLEQAPARLLRPCGRARRLGPARGAARRERRRSSAWDGLRDPDLVGWRRAALACHRQARRRGQRLRRDGDPGHRHGHAHERADRGGRGARAPARPRAGRSVATRATTSTARSRAARRRRPR